MGLLEVIGGSAVVSWHHIKAFIEQMAGFSHDAIHVLVGGIGPLIVARLSRRTVASWLPWLAMLVLILLNEAADLAWEQWDDLARQYGDSAKDILLTMALPTVLMVTARRWPGTLVGDRRISDPGGDGPSPQAAPAADELG